MFYELKNNLAADEFKIEKGTDFSFPSHLHGSFEITTVIDGKMCVVVDKKEYILEKGQMIFIFPNQVHEFRYIGSCSHYLCIFSTKLVAAYAKTKSACIPKSNIFSPDEYIINAFLSLRQDDSLIKIKGVLYSLCAEFDATASYEEKKNDGGELLPLIFKFVENNFSSICTLRELARSISFNYEYLSKYFRDRMGITFTDYVRSYRISEACYILANSDESILSVSLECGFESLRSFNRNFKKTLGIPPSEYREKSITKSLKT